MTYDHSSALPLDRLRLTRSHAPPDDAHQSSTAPLPAWRQAQEDEAARPVVHSQWQPFQWGREEGEPDAEREPWSNMRGVYGVPRHDPDSSPDPAPEAYAHTCSTHRPPASSPAPSRSSFRGGTTVIATASARDSFNPDPVAIVPILVGLDSYSDVTVATRAIIYNIREIEESLGTGAGPSEYHEEGLVDIADGLYSFRTSRLPVPYYLAHLS
jgi:hypothetical protein